MKIAIASDHAGFVYKSEIIGLLESKGYSVQDFGTDSQKSCDYPDFIVPAVKAVTEGSCDRAIVLGGSGNGEAMAANKVKGARCSLCWDLRSAKFARQHNDANVLSIGERMVSLSAALEIVELWLDTKFDGGRHQARIDKLDEI